MKVILTQDIKSVGKKGQIIDASDGYARNFLLPKKMAVIADNANLNANYTFESFIVGDSNKFAFKAARMVAEAPGTYNPLFLYGESGVGKTHLMHAIGNYLIQNIYPVE